MKWRLIWVTPLVRELPREGVTGEDSHTSPKGSVQSNECPEWTLPEWTVLANQPELLPLGYFFPFIQVSANILSISSVMHEGEAEQETILLISSAPVASLVQFEQPVVLREEAAPVLK